MATSDRARDIEQLQNRISGLSELPETVRSDVIVALGAAREASSPAAVKASLEEALALLESETASSRAAADVAQAIRNLLQSDGSLRRPLVRLRQSAGLLLTAD